LSERILREPCVISIELTIRPRVFMNKLSPSPIPRQLLEDADFGDIQWQEYSPAQYRRYNSVEADPLVARVKAGFSGYMEVLDIDQPDPEAIFDQFGRFCILTATHGGYSGREESNRLAVHALGFNEEHRWYHGRPVMVVKNDYQTGLFNGDVGICFKLDEDLRVYFPDQEGFKSFTPSRVPAHETAFAITVHKSKGSEFQHVLMLLPDSYTRVVSRALIYTGITRARESLELWGGAEVFLG